MKYPSEMASPGSGRIVSYDYDAAGRPTLAVPGADLQSADKYADQIEYHSHGAMSQMALSNGVVEGYGYNSRLQPTSITAVKDAATLLSLVNDYGSASNNGNVLS